MHAGFSQSINYFNSICGTLAFIYKKSDIYRQMNNAYYSYNIDKKQWIHSHIISFSINFINFYKICTIIYLHSILTSNKIDN